ncbi:MAG: hypothetical protein DSY53_02125 [Persephonella sp.]|nr:MAG: hypothetical protein DSY53_02125 [Persephonella sp.]
MITQYFAQKKLLFLSITFEISSIYLLFFTKDFTGKIFAVLILHTLASITLSQIVWLILPKRYKKPFPLSLISLFVIVFSTPIVSYIALIILYIILKKQKPKTAYPFNHFSIWKGLEELRIPKRKFGEAAIIELVRNTKIPAEKRLKAFIFLTEAISPETVQLLKLGLSDPNDEIRLLCFSELSKIEKKITSSIHYYMNILENAKDDKEYLDALENLAKSYWEAVYLGIGDEEINKYYINQTYKYALKAIEFAEEKNLQVDPHVILILGKINLLKGDYESAERLLRETLDSNIPKFEVIPSLAKLYYEKGEFSKVKELFMKYPYLRYDFDIYPIYALWSGE